MNLYPRHHLLRSLFFTDLSTLQPSNILLDSDCLVKVCDFGLTRSLTRLHDGVRGSVESFSDTAVNSGDPELTEYVATRWYRAPEILLASSRYTKFVDMWSLGCILGEMLRGKPLFPGSSTINQIERIVSVVDKPSDEGWSRVIFYLLIDRICWHLF